jgi:hypothetical protein
VGIFVISNWEPEDGDLNLSWQLATRPSTLIVERGSYVADENEGPDKGEDADAHSRGNVITAAASRRQTKDDDGQKLNSQVRR